MWLVLAQDKGRGKLGADIRTGSAPSASALTSTFINFIRRAMIDSALEGSSGAVISSRPSWLDEVEAIDRQILAAKARRNTLVPISRLPPEVLGYIFEDVAHKPICAFHSLSALHSAAAWPAVMLVCRDWRDIAVRHHGLWTSLSEKNLRHWPLFLERSHSQLIDIRLNTDSEEIDVPVLAAFAQLHRVRSLELRIQETKMDSLLPLLCKPAPKLDSLVLDILYGVTDRQHRGLIRTRTGRWITSLQKEFVSELAPNIRRADLSGVCFPWGACATNLRDLTLDSGTQWRNISMISPQDKFALSDVCCTLSHSALESLRIKNVSGTIVEDADTSGATSSLPHLKWLSISNSPANLSLSIWLSTTEMNNVDIEMDELPHAFTIDQFEALLRHTMSHLSRQSKVKHLTVRFSSSFKIDSDVIKFGMPSPNTFSINRSAVAGQILSAATLEHLTRLELGDRLQLTRPIVETVFPRLSQLVDLSLSATSSSVAAVLSLFVSHLYEPNGKASTAARPPNFPLLKSLLLSHTDFTWTYGGRQLSSLMEKALKTRVKRAPHLGPSKVEIKDCDVTQEMVRSWMIGKRVDVWWDGRTGKCPSPPPPSPRGPMLWDSENEEYYEAEIAPSSWNPDIPVWDQDSD